ncbi:GNAT family N-acetyltransferase [Nakamurella antarctica]|uniref:GNAT family N-acetyltransferase n=1 Tax=Nakamurella antarctica TaxID=1902245 RepID=A0A3G8ZS44_9ACTN|nr:GNAT family N-acetyltransferase [Nakamurella antarctica]AZI56896.1 GNAT family N-acetyltransferase [Nakamurella antarctica]
MPAKTTYLQQTDSLALKFSKAPQKPVRIERVICMTPEFGAYLYTAVGGAWQWTERQSWTDDKWRDWYGMPGSETWVAYADGAPTGFLELAPQPCDGGTLVEIANFGLVPGFIGQGIGGHLLSVGIHKAWSFRRRWPEFPAVQRVWLHTSTDDSPVALPNFEARGFQIYHTEEPGRGR